MCGSSALIAGWGVPAQAARAKLAKKIVGSLFILTSFVPLPATMERVDTIFRCLNKNLYKLKQNYQSIGYSATEIKLHLNKLYSLPIYLTLTTIIGSLLMFKFSYIKSKFFLVVIGVFVSVTFYYINYFAILFGKNETLPVEIAIWLPQLLIFLICTLGLTKLNEN